MKVLIVNTSEKTGGAAVAAGRLMAALNNHGVEARMLVRDKATDSPLVTGLRRNWLSRWRFLWERWCIFSRIGFSKKHLFEIDIANTGADITQLPEFREADVVHLHWVNQGMLSLSGIRKILKSGKPVVWTMHDVWPATAICHYTQGCRAFTTQCGNCQLLPSGGSPCDLSNRVWRRKMRMLDGSRVSFVACSRWLEGQARQSALLAGHRVTSIPNAIDTQVFFPQDKAEARRKLNLPADKRLLLFVSQRVTDRRKGIGYLVEAIRMLVEAHPEMKDNTGVAILGSHSEEVAGQLALPAFPLGYMSDAHQIAEVYSAVNLFVLPSLEDNLPNTIMEAMACGVPCVGFEVGGIPEEIDHLVNGYVARYKDTSDLAEGIRWVLDETDRKSLGAAAVEKVAAAYSQGSVAARYKEVYNETLLYHNRNPKR